jgi:Sensors of blue-light using FAD
VPLTAIDSVAFASKSRIDLRALTALVRWSRERNESLGVTGLLLFDGYHFFGYLEGEPLLIEQLYAAIEADARHERLRQLARGPLDVRCFERWFMGYLYEPMFDGELEALWNGQAEVGDLKARMRRWHRHGDVL